MAFTNNRYTYMHVFLIMTVQFSKDLPTSIKMKYCPYSNKSDPTKNKKNVLKIHVAANITA